MKNSTQPTYEAIRKSNLSELTGLDNDKLSEIKNSIFSEANDIEVQLTALEKRHQDLAWLSYRANTAYEWIQSVQYIKQMKQANPLKRMTMFVLPTQILKKLQRLDHQQRAMFNLAALEVLTSKMEGENGK